MQPRIVSLAALILLLGLFSPARADPPAPDHDYFVLALSWTPGWCARGSVSARDDTRCAPGAGTGWSVHGLWPQRDDGSWPEFCASSHAPPSRAQTAAMADIMGDTMGDGGLAWYQWRKHGTCSGLSASDYFAQVRAAAAAVALPDPVALADGAGRLAPGRLTGAIRAASTGLGARMLTVTCRQGGLHEVRLCMDRDLRPRDCDAGMLRRACRSGVMSVTPPP